MTFAITNLTLNGQTFQYLDGSRNQVYVSGSIKQWDGSNWNRTEIPGKSKERRITFSGFVQTDEEKTLLEALRTNTIFTDYNDGIITSFRCVVLDVSLTYNNGTNLWNYNLTVEEYLQT